MRQAIKRGDFEWRKHTLIRLAERNIAQKAVLEAILEGEIIEEYLEDKPFPSCLIFKIVHGEPLHVVVSFDEEAKRAYIITAYKPSLDKFESDFKKEEMMERCPLCKGEMKEGLTIYSVELGFGVVVVRNVPAKICSQCGEEWIEAKVAEELENIVNNARKNQLEVEVVSFKTAVSI